MALLITFISIALVFSFICSISEAVLLKMTPSFVQSLKTKKPNTYKLLYKQTRQIDKSLAAILSLNTIAHTIGASGAGGQVVELYGSTALGLLSVVLTIMILVFTEIIPKIIGATYWRQLAPTVAYTLKYLITIMYPFVILGNLITKTMRKGKKTKLFNREEFAAMADIGLKEGQLKTKDLRILNNLLQLKDAALKDILTPRTVVFSVPETLSIKDFFVRHPDVTFSRIPIYAENHDDVTGFVLLSDLLKAKINGKTNEPLTDFSRPINVLPETISISRFFEFLLNTSSHIVIVVDEYGSFEGIATMEDVLETLLGLEIVDEVDHAVDMQEVARTKWQKRAKALEIKHKTDENNSNSDEDPNQQ